MTVQTIIGLSVARDVGGLEAALQVETSKVKQVVLSELLRLHMELNSREQELDSREQELDSREHDLNGMIGSRDDLATELDRMLDGIKALHQEGAAAR